MAGFYTTSHAFSLSTTSTLALVIWKALSDSLVEHRAPLTAEQVAEIAGITPEQAEGVLNQQYYQRHYGFKRVESLVEFEQWAKETGVIGSPTPETPAADEADADADEESDEE